MLKALGSIVSLLLLLLFSLSVATESAATDNDPYLILQQHYQAIGGLERLKKLESSYAEGRIRHDQLLGRYRFWGQPPLRYRLEEDYGIIRQQEGDDGEQRWQRDTNGQLLIDRDPETLKRRQIERRLARYEHVERDSEVFSLKYLGAEEVEGRLCDKVELRNSINRDVSLFYIDRDSRMVIQAHHQQPDFELSVRYADFRSVGGFIFPFYEKTLIQPWNKEEEVWTERQLVDLPVAESLFAVPQQRANDFSFPQGRKSAESNFLLAENMIYLPVCFEDDCRYWVLDSGASMSVIDADYAHRLGLQPEGEISGHGFGDHFKLSFVETPAYRVGEVVFKPQKVYVAEGVTENSYEPEEAGILGYDFLSRFVVEIDYAARKIRFHDPDSYRYSGNGQVFDAPLKYRTFQLPVVLEGLSGRWSLDLGSHRSSLSYDFAERHQLLQRAGVETVGQGLASFSFSRIVEFAELKIGKYSLHDVLLNLPREKGAGASALGEISGHLGNSTLRNFRLILDYPRQQVILEPGAEFDQSQPRDGSGLLVGMSHDNQPMASFVAPGSPAEQAGFVAGDLIESIDERPIAEIGGVVAVRRLLRQPPETELRFRVRRGDELLELNLTLQNLYPASTD